MHASVLVFLNVFSGVAPTMVHFFFDRRLVKNHLCSLFAFLLLVFSTSTSWADVSEDKHAKVALAFLHRKKRLGMMVKLLTKLISSSKVRTLYLKMFEKSKIQNEMMYYVWPRLWHGIIRKALGVRNVTL